MTSVSSYSDAAGEKSPVGGTSPALRPKESLEMRRTSLRGVAVATATVGLFAGTISAVAAATVRRRVRSRGLHAGPRRRHGARPEPEHGGRRGPARGPGDPGRHAAEPGEVARCVLRRCLGRGHGRAARRRDRRRRGCRRPRGRGHPRDRGQLAQGARRLDGGPGRRAVPVGRDLVPRGRGDQRDRHRRGRGRPGRRRGRRGRGGRARLRRLPDRRRRSVPGRSPT